MILSFSTIGLDFSFLFKASIIFLSSGLNSLAWYATGVESFVATASSKSLAA